MRITRRDLMQAAAAAALAGGVGDAARGNQRRDPHGASDVKTGPLASGGIDMERALVMYLKERNDELAGRKVELIVADTAGVPATARTKSQEPVERNNVHYLIGSLAAFEALAVDRLYPPDQDPDAFGCGGRGHHPNPWSVHAKQAARTVETTTARGFLANSSV